VQPYALACAVGDLDVAGTTRSVFALEDRADGVETRAPDAALSERAAIIIATVTRTTDLTAISVLSFDRRTLIRRQDSLHE
jgi:hypothetical protein